MPLLIVSSHSNELACVKVDENGKRVSSDAVSQQQATANSSCLTTTIVDPLPEAITSDPRWRDEQISTEFTLKHPKFNLLFVLTSFGTKHKSILTTFRVYACGSLERLSSSCTGGYQACHASVNPKGTCLAVAHLHCGRVSFFSIAEDEEAVAAEVDRIKDEPSRILRLPVIHPYNLLLPHLSTTGLGVPAAHSVTFSPRGDFLCIAEPSQHAVFTYRCHPTTGYLQSLEAYKAKKGLPLSNSAFSHVRATTDYDPVSWCQNLAIFMGGDWGPRVRRALINPNLTANPNDSSKYLYALQESSNSISVYRVEHNGMIVPKRLQELRVAQLPREGSLTSSQCCAALGSTSVTDMQAFEDGLIVSITSSTASENGLRVVHYDRGGKALRLGQHIPTKLPVQSFVRRENELWVSLNCEYKSLILKYRKERVLDDGNFATTMHAREAEFVLVGQSSVDLEVLSLTMIDEVTLPRKPCMMPQGRSITRAASDPFAAAVEESEEDKRLRAAFEKRDLDGSGYLEEDEIAKLLEGMGKPATAQDVSDFIRAIDKDGDGRINFEEFSVFLKRRMKNASTKRHASMGHGGLQLGSSTARSRPTRHSGSLSEGESLERAKLRKAFDKRDLDQSGYLEHSEVAQMLSDLGQTAATKDVSQFIRAIDTDGDGRIDFDEFCVFHARLAKKQAKREKANNKSLSSSSTHSTSSVRSSSSTKSSSGASVRSSGRSNKSKRSGGSSKRSSSPKASPLKAPGTNKPQRTDSATSVTTASTASTVRSTSQIDLSVTKSKSKTKGRKSNDG